MIITNVDGNRIDLKSQARIFGARQIEMYLIHKGYMSQDTYVGPLYYHNTLDLLGKRVLSTSIIQTGIMPQEFRRSFLLMKFKDKASADQFYSTRRENNSTLYERIIR